MLLDEPLSNLDANLREEMRFEVRRLHDEYRYTTVYVTHDQSEAMTTADLIAVMNAGKIEQAGSPEEIYDRPRSEFVARFIGSSNIVKGKALRCRSHRGRGRGAALHRRSDDGRQPDRDLDPPARDRACRPTQPRRRANAVPATVIRHVFLGNSRDYMVELADGTPVARGDVRRSRASPQGDKVWLHLPPQRCRVLVG